MRGLVPFLSIAMAMLTSSPVTCSGQDAASESVESDETPPNVSMRPEDNPFGAGPQNEGENGPAVDADQRDIVANRARLAAIEEQLTLLQRSADQRFREQNRAIVRIEQALSRLENSGLPPRTHSVAFDAAAASAPLAPARKIWCYVAVDDRPVSPQTGPNGIAEGASVNRVIMAALLEQACTPDGQDHLGGGRVRVFDANQRNFTFTHLIQAINNDRDQMDPDNDVIFVYIGCHGLSDNRGGLAFQMPRDGSGIEIVDRTDVWDLMKSTGVRQTILFSDSCASRIAESSAAPDVVSVASADSTSPKALTALLLFQEGDVNINGANPNVSNTSMFSGQIGIYNNQGGYSTRAFASVSRREWSSDSISWRRFFMAAQDALKDNFYSRNTAGHAVNVGVSVRMPDSRVETVRAQNYYLVP